MQSHLGSKSLNQTSKSIEELTKDSLHIGKLLGVFVIRNEKAAVPRINQNLKAKQEEINILT